MKNKIVKIILILIIVMVIGIVILNMFPEVEEALHKITGWD